MYSSVAAGGLMNQVGTSTPTSCNSDTVAFASFFYSLSSSFCGLLAHPNNVVTTNDVKTNFFMLHSFVCVVVIVVV